MIKILFLIILLSFIQSNQSNDITFIEISPTDEVTIELKEGTIDLFYALTCDKLNDSDTILNFKKGQVDFGLVKIYIYWNQQAAIDDYEKYSDYKWTNEVIGQNFDMHFKEEEGKSIDKLYVVFHCVGCTNGVTFNEIFQLTNELVQVTTLLPKEEIMLTKLYSQKFFQIKMLKDQQHYGFRYSFELITDQNLKIEIYLVTDTEKLIDKMDITQSKEISRTYEYDSTAVYLIKLATDANKDNFQLKVKCELFIQTPLIEIGKRLQIDFGVKHDLYFYLLLDQYALYEENSITLSIQQNEGEEPITSTIYAKDFQLPTDKVINYDKSVPKTKEESIFPFTKKGSSNYVLYFKRSEENNVLLINVVFINEKTKGSIILSQKTRPIEVLYLDSLEKIDINLEENVPFRLTFMCFPAKRNLFIYSPHIGTQTIYIGTILNDKLVINDQTVESELYSIIDYASGDIATIEYFGKAGTYYIYVEPIALPIYFLYNRRNNENFFYDLNEIGKTYYFIETTSKATADMNLVLKEQYGKFEYYFKDKIEIKEGIKSLLPEFKDTITGLKKLETMYSLTGIKVISPGRIEMIIQPIASQITEFSNYVQYHQIYSKGNSYTINLPKSANKEFNLEISALLIEEKNAEIELEIEAEKMKLSQKSKINIKSKEIKVISITNIISNSALTFRLISLPSPFVEITPETIEIKSQNVILKLMNDKISKYELKLGKSLTFDYEIGSGEIDFISNPSLSKTSIQNEICLSFSNPSNKYGQMSKGYYYLTISFKPENLPVPITIITVNQLSYPSLEINSLQTIKTETTFALVKSDDYDPTEKSLFILSSPCIVGHSQKIILSDENNNEIQSFSVAKSRRFITQSNLHIPLFLEYIDDERSINGFTAFINYNYLTANQIEAMEILMKAEYSITYKDNKLEWRKPAEIDLEFIIYYIESGKNESAMDNECYLSTLEGNKTRETTFELNLNVENKTNYVIGIRAVNNKIITFGLIYTPIKIEIEANVGDNLLWLWITISAVVVTAIIITLVIIYGKKKDDLDQNETARLIPQEQESNII